MLIISMKESNFYSPLQFAKNFIFNPLTESNLSKIYFIYLSIYLPSIAILLDSINFPLIKSLSGLTTSSLSEVAYDFD